MAQFTRSLPQTPSPRSDWQSRGQQACSLEPLQDLTQYLQAYTRKNPGTVAMWCFGLGFVVGWRLKPW